MLNFSGQMNCYYNYAASASESTKVSEQCSDFYETLLKSLSVLKICNGNAYSDGCIPKYSKYSVAPGCPGFSEDYINNKNTAYVINNGLIIIPYNTNVPLFLIDINGYKKPNKFGYDLFAFEIKYKKNKGYYLAQGRCNLVEDGGHSVKEMLQYVYSNSI